MADHAPDDRLFDRLVDGALSPREQRELIASLDDCEQGWRRCALRFLEAQSWSTQFRSLLGDEALTSQASTNQPAHRSAAIATIATTPHRRAAAMRAGRWLAIAAGLLVSFGLGRFASPLRLVQQEPMLASSEERNPIDANSKLANSRAAKNDAANADGKGPDWRPEERNRPADDALTLVVRGKEGKLVRVSLPLVDSHALGFPLADATAEPHAERLRGQLQQQGWNLQTRRRYAPLFFEQGGSLTPMVMPVDDAFVTPVVRQVY